MLETRIYYEIPAAARRQNDGKGMAEVLSLWNMNSSAQHGSTAARCGLERTKKWGLVLQPNPTSVSLP